MPRTTAEPIISPLVARIERLKQLVDKLTLVPEDWLQRADESPEGAMSPKACQEWTKLIASWRVALEWTPGLEKGLAVMLASIMSTRTVGEPLWIKLVSPPSTGKSTLCEAVTVSSRYVVAKSTIRGFHSGFDMNDGKDHSLISQVAGRTLVIKDGDTLLQSPNLNQILSEGRDAYDGNTRTSYRNRASKDYTGVRFTWILAGTSSLRQLDTSELGARFLDCVIMHEIDEEMEDLVLRKVANGAAKGLLLETNCSAKTHYDPDLSEAMQLTGGYVEYLRNNVQKILNKIEISDKAKGHCIHLGKWVAILRARPSDVQEEVAEREFAARLVSQITRLAICLAGVLQRSEVDVDVLQLTRAVAHDTARGQTMEIIDYLYETPRGCSTKEIAEKIIKDRDSTFNLLRFLKQIKALNAEKERVSSDVGRQSTFDSPVDSVNVDNQWELTHRIRKLYQQVHPG